MESPIFQSHHEKKMDIILQRLRDSGYKGDLTIEIDDKIYPGQLTREEKIKELTNERKYLESIFNERRLSEDYHSYKNYYIFL